MDYHSSYSGFPKYLATKLGRTLGLFHRSTKVEGLPKQHQERAATVLPFGLRIHCPDLNIYGHASQAAVELIKIIHQTDEFCEFFDELPNEWKVETLIHGDIRWDNCNLYSRSTLGRSQGIKIVDWELANFGDPCWDIGTIFNEYLSFWLQSAPISEETPPEKFLRFAKRPLDRMQPAIRAFWDAYKSETRLDVSRADQSLTRAIKYTAARLVQTAYERVQLSSNMSAHSIFLLQLSLNIFRRPHEALVQLLGIP